MPPLQHRPPSPHNTAQSSPPLPPFFSSRPSLSTSSSTSTTSSGSSATSDSSLDHSFRQLTLREAHRPASLVYGFKEDEDVPDLQELYSQDTVYHTEQGMLQRRDSWDARNRESTHSAATGQSSPPSPASSRPPLPHLTSSFSKRHASFHSQREVPLSSMPSRLPDYCNSPSHAQDNEQPRLPVLVLRSYNLPQRDNDNASAETCSNGATAGSAPSSSDFKPSTTSVPHNVDMDIASEDAPPSPSAPQRTQRASTGPVTPFSRPFSSPDFSSSRVLSPRPVRAVELSDRLSTASLPLPMHTPYQTLPSLSGQTGAEDEAHAQDHAMQDPSPSPGLSLNISGNNAEAGPSTGWGVSVNSDVGRSTSPRMSPTRHSPRHSNRSPAPYIFGDWTQYTDEALMAAAASSHTRPFSTNPASAHHLHHPYSRLSRRPMSPSSVHSAHSAHSYPPPTPPTILTPPPPEERDPSTPYVPFLSHGPPSEETYIAVETLPDEYTLHVRLPGYRRDAITLSTRKRRILHLVADSWEPEGGHFERRILFGYDADLSQVRAEFDGEMLRVFIQRRLPPSMTYWSSGRD